MGCKDVAVSDCFVHNGDDCLTVKGGCEDVLIADSYFASGHGASVGSVTDVGAENPVPVFVRAELRIFHGKLCAGVRNVTFRNILLNGPPPPHPSARCG